MPIFGYKSHIGIDRRHGLIRRWTVTDAAQHDSRSFVDLLDPENTGQPHTVNPRTITVDKNPAYPCAIAEMKADNELWRFARLRQCKFLNNIVEQDHRRMKRLVRAGLGFGGLHTARRTLAGYEAMAMIRKGQAHEVGGRDMRAQATCVAQLFQVAA
ncbi:DDE-type integrase/transposase/recombinase [Pseudoroseomonas wenyumeiae]